MEVRVLGPVEVWRDGEQLSLPGRQHRLVLGYLALAANTLVTYDRLVDLLWADRLPKRPRAVLHTRVSELRTSLADVLADGEEVELRTRDDGYLLVAPADVVDSGRFLTACRDWRQMTEDVARGTLREALGLWRGPVLGGGLSDEAYRSFSVSLELARLTATEDLFELELRAGRHQEVVDEIVGYAVASPTRDRLLVQAMRALQRSGRASEALQLYDRTRRWLAEELGTDPGREAYGQYLEILRDQPAPVAATPRDIGKPATVGGIAAPAENTVVEFEPAVPRMLPQDVPHFTGRSDEVARIRGLLTRSAGGARILTITGRGGVGKTALAIHVAHLLAGEFPHGQLYLNLRGFDTASPVKPADALGRLLRILGVDGASLPNGSDERAELYRQLLADRRTLVVLDNALDDSQIELLMPGTAAARVVISSRQPLGVLQGAHILELDALRPGDAARLLNAIAGSRRAGVERKAVADVAELCGQLPLALRIVGGRLRSRPHWTFGSLARQLRDRRTRLDHLRHGTLDVRASTLMSYDGLSEDAQLLFRRLGALDLPHFSSWAAQASLGTPIGTTVSCLEQLVDARLLEASREDIGNETRYHLHDLVRLFAAERAALEEPTEALVEADRRVSSACLFLAEAAGRSIFGTSFRTMPRAASRWRPAGRAAEQAAVEPLRWLNQELETIVTLVNRLAEDDQAAHCCEIVAAVCQMLQMLRRFDKASELVDVALSVADGAGDSRAKATLLYQKGWLCTDRTEYDLALDHFVQSAELFGEAGDQYGYAVAEIFIGMIERQQGNYEDALARYSSAAAALRNTGDHGAVGYALRGIGQAHVRRGDLERAEPPLRSALEACHLGRSRQGEAQVICWLGMLYLQQQRFSDAEEQFKAALELAVRLGDRPGEAQCLNGLGRCYQGQGRRDEAKEELRKALKIVRQPLPTLMEARIRETLATL